MLKLGIVGFGKIARDEHAPAIALTGGLELAGVADPRPVSAAMPIFPTLEAMLAGLPELGAVVLCQPPPARYTAAKVALEAGKHVFLEKPPGVTLGEVEYLRALAAERRLTLFAGWHSRFSQQFNDLRSWCAGRKLQQVSITWKEDVRLWHPGQDWIWEDGGFGVLDPGINALSILTGCLSEPVSLRDATLFIPANRATPIAASMYLETAGGAPVDVAFDWRQTGPQIWRIELEADGGNYCFDQSDAGAASAESPLSAEYRSMYRRFADLVRDGASDVDLAPLRIVADAWSLGRIEPVEPFDA